MAKTPLFDVLSRAISHELKKIQTPRVGHSPHRRNFLKAGLLFGAAAVPTGFSTNLFLKANSRWTSFSTNAISQDSVVVLGGGLAGLTAAYRLSQAGVPVKLFEGSERLGGRIFTRNNFNSEGMFCELGGELIDTTHEDTLDLARELGLEMDDFTTDSQVASHQYYFSNQYYYDEDLVNACKPFAARLLEDMQKVFVDMTNIVVTYQNITPYGAALDKISLAEYLHSLKDVDQWFVDAVRVAFLGEYGLETSQQSCLNLLLLLNPNAEQFGILGDSDESIRIRGGNSRLIEALADKLDSQADISLGHRLVNIKDNGHRTELHFSTSSGTKVVRTQQVICALPFSTLRDVEGLKSLGLSPTKLKCIQELSYGANSKYMFGFSERIWRQPTQSQRASSGYVFTDLPAQTYWDTSRLQNGNSGIVTNFLGGLAALKDKKSIAHLALKNLEQVYPGTSRLHDGNTAGFAWAKYNFAKGSYACPTVTQYTNIIGSAKEPELNGRLLFAGEHVSELYQGYMNGAVESANEAATTIVAARNYAISS